MNKFLPEGAPEVIPAAAAAQKQCGQILLD
jgi:hypothetical protein